MAAWDTRIQCLCPQHPFHKGDSTTVQNTEMPTTVQHSSPYLHHMKSPELNAKVNSDTTWPCCTPATMSQKEPGSTDLREAVCHERWAWMLAQKPNRPHQSLRPASDTFEEAGSMESTTTWNPSHSPRGHRKYVHWVVWYLTYFFIIKWRQRKHF